MTGVRLGHAAPLIVEHEFPLASHRLHAYV
jgi:hypothetical protein